MFAQPPPLDRPRADQIAALRAQLAHAQSRHGPALAFGLAALDDRLADHGLDGAGLHEIAPARPSLSDDAAATLFAAGIAARFASQPGSTVLWALSKFDLYAPGLEQVGLGPDRILYAQGRKDAEVLAMAEDALRDGSVACVIAESGRRIRPPHAASSLRHRTARRRCCSTADTALATDARSISPRRR
jgi:protein ImuA